MNILLYSPGLAFVLLKKGGIKGTLEKIALCAVVQVQYDVYGFMF